MGISYYFYGPPKKEKIFTEKPIKILTSSDILINNLKEFINENKNENNKNFYIKFKSKNDKKTLILNQIDVNKLENEEKNLIINKKLFIISKNLLKINDSQIENIANNKNLNIFLENIEGNLNEYLSNHKNKLEIEEVKEIFFQFIEIFIKFFEKNNNFIHDFINFENIFYKKENDNKIKIFYFPFEKNEILKKFSPEKILKKKKLMIKLIFGI